MSIPVFARQARAAVLSGVHKAGTALLILALVAQGASGLAAGRPGQNRLPAPQSGERVPSPNQNPDLNPSPLTPKQQRDLLKANFAKMKQDADQLADLAKSLQEELNKSNENVLSLDIVEKADKIEKLAKKIKNSALQ